MANKDDVGHIGEQLAADYLSASGVLVLERNWRGTRGELDAVALDGRTLVAVEVKTRSGLGFGHPAAGVTEAKLARIRRLAGEWIALRGADHRGQFTEIRIDVIAVTLRPDADPVIEHLRGVS